MTVTLIACFIVVALVFLRIPVGFAMLLVGILGIAHVRDMDLALGLLGSTTMETVVSFELSVIPLFLLMGNVINRANISRELYDCANKFVAHRRGGLAMATVMSCGVFSAICGSSLATVATISKVALPAMRRHNYSDELAAGAIAAGGTLGVLIPPSVLLILYGLLTETSIGQLFAAGFIPGIIGVGFYLLAVQAAVWYKPSLGPAAERFPWRERLQSTKGVLLPVLLFLVVIGGIYAGFFTPTESAGIGAIASLMIAFGRGNFNLTDLKEVLIETVLVSASLFFILIGALYFSHLVTLSGFATSVLDLLGGANTSPMLVIFGIILIYLVLGCIMDSMAMVMLTVPIFAPLVMSLGFHPVWFGIIVVVVSEISFITPPIGINIFVLRSNQPDLSISTIYRGVTPFWISDLFRLAVLTLFPALSLWLPSILF